MLDGGARRRLPWPAWRATTPTTSTTTATSVNELARRRHRHGLVDPWQHLTLAAYVENLRFNGVGGFLGIGNGLDNVIAGGAGTDPLYGADGNDVLIGGAGADALTAATASTPPPTPRPPTASTPGCWRRPLRRRCAPATPTPASRTSTGSAFGDVRSTGERSGGNTLAGLGGNDLLIGAAGIVGADDVLRGGAGRRRAVRRPRRRRLRLQRARPTRGRGPRRHPGRAWRPPSRASGSPAATGSTSRASTPTPPAAATRPSPSVAPARATSRWSTRARTPLVRGNTDGDAAFEFELVIEDGGILASAYRAIDFVL